MLGSPHGVPGGGITGVRPPPTGGTEIPGSTPAGGQITPLDCESWSLKGRLPVVSFERGAPLPISGGHSFCFDGEDGGAVSERLDCACANGIENSMAAPRAAATNEFAMLMSPLADKLSFTWLRD